MKNEKMVTITRKEYDELIHDQMKLIALESAGVDNWCGWDDAMEILEEMENKEAFEEKEYIPKKSKEEF